MFDEDFEDHPVLTFIFIFIFVIVVTLYLAKDVFFEEGFRFGALYFALGLIFGVTGIRIGLLFRKLLRPIIGEGNSVFGVLWYVGLQLLGYIGGISLVDLLVYRVLGRS